MAVLVAWTLGTLAGMPAGTIPDCPKGMDSYFSTANPRLSRLSSGGRCEHRARSYALFVPIGRPPFRVLPCAGNGFPWLCLRRSRSISARRAFSASWAKVSRRGGPDSATTVLRASSARSSGTKIVSFVFGTRRKYAYG